MVFERCSYHHFHQKVKHRGIWLAGLGEDGVAVQQPPGGGEHCQWGESAPGGWASWLGCVKVTFLHVATFLILQFNERRLHWVTLPSTNVWSFQSRSGSGGWQSARGCWECDPFHIQVPGDQDQSFLFLLVLRRLHSLSKRMTLTVIYMAMKLFFILVCSQLLILQA